MDDLARSWRPLLIALFVASCSPAKREPVGVSNGGTLEHKYDDASVAVTPILPGFPAEFRAAWTKTGARFTSEHGRFAADAYETEHARWAEELFAGDASAGVYLIERVDGGVRFAVTDPHGRAVADSAADGGASIEPCARCHANARDAIFPIQ